MDENTADTIRRQSIRILSALNHIDTPFFWCGLSSDQRDAVYWHVRGKSTRQTGEIMGKSKHTVRKYLVLAVRKINKAEDWEINIRDLADVLINLIEGELSGSETRTGNKSSNRSNRTAR